MNDATLPEQKASPAQRAFARLRDALRTRIIGQEALVDRLLIALLADGHLLVKGAPGLAKTTAVEELAARIEGDFHRVQFTPDLLPADLTGTEIYGPENASFVFQRGPLFHNVLLADEVNRAPAKVQSALLEAMGERQITVGRTTYKLPPLFLVMATQNPIEQEGTYPLPEAQLDRFLLYVRIDYPTGDAEQAILRLARDEAHRSLEANGEATEVMRVAAQAIFDARREVLDMHLSQALERYLVELVLATRTPARYGDDLARWIAFGASPRASIALDQYARPHAWLDGRDYVAPHDIQAITHDVLRHRVLLGFDAEADGIDPDCVVDALLSRVAVPRAVPAGPRVARREFLQRRSRRPARTRRRSVPECASLQPERSSRNAPVAVSRPRNGILGVEDVPARRRHPQQ